MAENISIAALRTEEVKKTKTTISNLFHEALKSRGMCQCKDHHDCDDFATRGDKVLFKSIKRVIEECLSELSPEDKFAYKKKRINNRVYWYAVWWDKAAKRKMEKYVSAGAEPPPEAKAQKVVMEEKLRRQMV